MQSLQKYLTTNQKKHLIFDFDRTLYWINVDRENYKKLINEYIQNTNPKLLEQHQYGKPRWILETEMVKKYGKEAKTQIWNISNLVEWNIHGYQKHLELINFIQNNSTNYKISIRSSNLKSTITWILQKENMQHYFQNIITKDKVDLIKGYPDGFYQIHEPKTFERKDYLMIGDSLNDQLAAQHAGIDFFHINSSEVERVENN